MYIVLFVFAFFYLKLSLVHFFGRRKIYKMLPTTLIQDLTVAKQVA